MATSLGGNEAPDDFPDVLMRTAIRRISEDRDATSHTERLALAAELRAAAELRVMMEVVRCRRYGLSWADIGAALGTSAQAAHRRYSNASAPLDPEDLLAEVLEEKQEQEDEATDV
ncbi:hypothetical protein [Streptomyces sp. NPDC058632]|uniref:hypothetical protein n=1 Tax=Streptomyces sp. NPDC058632 TaxID=3346567 RepID=UPI00364D2655